MVHETQALATLFEIGADFPDDLITVHAIRDGVRQGRGQAGIEESRRTLWDHELSVCEYGETLNGDQQWCKGKHR